MAAMDNLLRQTALGLVEEEAVASSSLAHLPIPAL
jgi:hypothetical protein